MIVADTPQAPRRLAVAWGALVAGVMAIFYWLFYLPPRLVGNMDPDRFYHLGLSKLIAAHGLLRSLPQAEDLGWGRYFPDKEFLFHVVTGFAAWIGGIYGVMMVAPVLGTAIIVCLYSQLLRAIRPWQSALLCLAGIFLTSLYVGRLCLLRPHLLSILCFCLLLTGFLRRRAWLVLAASMGFALSYHAFYLVLVVVAAAMPFRLVREADGRPLWLWALAGLLIGILINPYFPSNLLMSWMHLQIALGMDKPPFGGESGELMRFGVLEGAQFMGIVPFSALAAVCVVLVRRPKPEEHADAWFLFALAVTLAAMSMVTARAIEYALPVCILLVGYFQRIAGWRGWLWLNLCAILMLQFHEDMLFYKDAWTGAMSAGSDAYLRAVATIPQDRPGGKVFNCEWTGGPYVFFLRPDLRFVDMLDPRFLWKASHEKYVIRENLLLGSYPDPYRVLRTVFHADYVLCAYSPALEKQMDADPGHFRPVSGSGMDQMRVYELPPN